MCDKLISVYGFKHFSTGDLLRAEVKKETPLGMEIDSYISKGDLVPGSVAVSLIKQNVLQLDLQQICIIDGYPRNQSNIDFWNEIIGDEIEVLGCIFLECSEETMKKRIMHRG